MNKLPVSEGDLAKAVEDLLDRYKWQWCHYRPARTSRGWRTPLSGHPGLLDYIAAKGSRLLIFELKSERGNLTPEQLSWWDVLILTKAEVYTWRPSDIQEIKDCLARKSD
mgnify:CR=1 FL=1|tara:strand:+ start:749 stop:1078 length:330 start_codon:yes stop_codon:yes gene_type:complete